MVLSCSTTVGEQRENRRVVTSSSPRTKLTHSRTPQELTRVIPSSSSSTSPESCRLRSEKSAFSSISPVRRATIVPPWTSTRQLSASPGPPVGDPAAIASRIPEEVLQIRLRRLKLRRHHVVDVAEAHLIG